MTFLLDWTCKLAALCESAHYRRFCQFPELSCASVVFFILSAVYQSFVPFTCDTFNKKTLECYKNCASAEVFFYDVFLELLPSEHQYDHSCSRLFCTVSSCNVVERTHAMGQPIDIQLLPVRNRL